MVIDEVGAGAVSTVGEVARGVGRVAACRLDRGELSTDLAATFRGSVDRTVFTLFAGFDRTVAANRAAGTGDA